MTKRDDAIEFTMRMWPVNGIWSYCEACEKGWPYWWAERTSMAGDGGYVLAIDDGSPAHAVPDSNEVVPCTKRRVA